MIDKKGFTLIELILVIVLIGIISGFVGGILFQETKMFTIGGSRKEGATESELLLERVLKDLRYAYRNEFNTGSNVKFKLPYDSFKKYSAVNLYKSGNRLFLKTDNNPSYPIANNVTYFNITTIRASYTNYTSRLNTRNLITVKVNIKKGDEELSLQTNVFLRNKR